MTTYTFEFSMLLNFPCYSTRTSKARIEIYLMRKSTRLLTHSLFGPVFKILVQNKPVCGGCNRKMPSLVNTEIEAAVKGFLIDQEKMTEVVERMTKEIKMGLAKDTHARAVIKCFVSHVQDLPTGKERGKYLALDLGGSNFRVLLVNLISNSDVETMSKGYNFPQTLMSGSGKALFDFLAECLSEFCHSHGLENESLALGFTFSFPLQQQGLSKGILVAWTKGFSCEGVVGKNVVSFMAFKLFTCGSINIYI